LAAGPLAGALVGLLWRRGWHGAAVAVDRYYRLKDRAATALEFLRRDARTPLQTLQIQDALEHLRRVDPGRVVPLRGPAPLPFAAVLVLAAGALLFWPFPAPVAEAGPAQPLPQVVAEAERIQDALQDLEEEARKEENKELQKLVEGLRQKA